MRGLEREQEQDQDQDQEQEREREREGGGGRGGRGVRRSQVVGLGGIDKTSSRTVSTMINHTERSG